MEGGLEEELERGTTKEKEEEEEDKGLFQWCVYYNGLL